MYLTGIADEASQDIDIQIQVTKTLGWNAIEARNVNGKNIHDISDEAFEKVCASLTEADVYINGFGSAIGNWAKDVRDDFSITEAEVKRCIPRMKKLRAKIVRIMSYKVNDGEEQFVAERIKRLKWINDAFSSEGIIAVHENCMNYGGMSYHHTLELLEAVPGLKLVFDTANPVFNKDRSKAGEPWQDAWEFYQNVKEHIAYVHIKDCLSPAGNNKEVYTYPGEGQGYVKEIIADLKACGYDGGISIEPHLAGVFHEADSVNADAGDPVEIYSTYGRQLMSIMASINYERALYIP